MTDRTARRAAGAIVAVALLTSVLGACTAPSGHPAGTGPARYVALGDSYVAGTLIGLPAGQPLVCGRALGNWPSRVADALDVRHLVDVSCNGATTTSLRRPTDGAPPQLDAVTPETDLVTVTIGGNDGLDLFPLVLSCLNLLPVPIGPPPFGRPCSSELGTDARDQLIRRIDAAGPEVAAILREIRRRAPRARVLLVGYPTVLPADGTRCWPRVPLLPVDVGFLRERYAQLQRVLADAAGSAGVEFVDLATPTEGHDACRPTGVAWINGVGLDPFGYPAHPNAAGHREVARVVAAAASLGT